MIHVLTDMYLVTQTDEFLMKILFTVVLFSTTSKKCIDHHLLRQSFSFPFHVGGARIVRAHSAGCAAGGFPSGLGWEVRPRCRIAGLD